MTDKSSLDKSGAPSCGVYVRIKHDPDMQLTGPAISALSTALKRRSTYARYMHAIEITLEDGFSQQALEKAAAFIQVAQMGGLVALLRGCSEVAEDLGTDGVIRETGKDAIEARARLGQDAIVGLACDMDITPLTPPVLEAIDCVTLGNEAVAPPEALLYTATVKKEGLICACLGPITPHTAPVYSRAGAHFIDTTALLFSHPKGPLQAAVNMIDSIERSLQHIHTNQY